MLSARLRGVTIAATLAVAMAFPAAANASEDVAISQAVSATAVKPGQLVTSTVTVTNVGTEAPPYGEVFVNLFSLSGRGQPAANPYLSASPSQGACSIEPAGAYQQAVCSLGPLASGASARIVAVVRVNETMNHFASLLPNAFQGGYQDDNNANNESVVKIAASRPPVLRGSKRIKLRGLPDGCASRNFKLRVKVKASKVKKVVASMFLGLDEGSGQTWRRSKKGKRLRAKVPVSRLDQEIGKVYKLKVKAKRKGKKRLKRVVRFELC